MANVGNKASNKMKQALDITENALGKTKVHEFGRDNDIRRKIFESRDSYNAENVQLDISNHTDNTMKQAFSVVDPTIQNTENIVQNPVVSKQSGEHSNDKDLTDAILEHEIMKWEQEDTQKNIAIIETLLESDLSKNEGLKSAFESLLAEEKSNLDELNADMNPSDTDELDSKINDNISVPIENEGKMHLKMHENLSEQSLPVENEGVDGSGVIEQKLRHITRMERMDAMLGTNQYVVTQDNEMSFEMDS